MRRKVRSGTPTPMARRQGAATAAREESGLPEGWSSADAAAAAVALPGASTVVAGVWGAWFSCKRRRDRRCQPWEKTQDASAPSDFPHDVHMHFEDKPSN